MHKHGRWRFSAAHGGTSLRGLTGPIAEGKPVEVVVSADDAPATVLTDEIALTAILRNLLSNAIKYTDRGEVRLTVRTGGGGVEIRVADTGTGIPVDQLERVFEEFYQVPGVRRGGTGLGLPYARRLAGLLGGELTLTSKLPANLPAIVITGLDVATPPRAAALLHKGELTSERLAFAIRGASGGAR